ncbi:MAG: hypothetical protein JXB60_06030 [Candidatus Cloacimonetes bacterium]|nr:hypothetical protein [Candidatus Cloacimonadota bacterium]
MLRLRKRERVNRYSGDSRKSGRSSGALLFTIVSGLAGYIIEDLTKPESRLKRLYNSIRQRISQPEQGKIPESTARQIKEIEVVD